MNVHIAGRRAALATLASALLALGALPAAKEPGRYLDRRGVALDGYDAVAYFTESRAVKGSEAFELTWDGARWRFASAANRDRFAAEPDRYAPQFGGYCAYAVSRGYTASADPQAWSVVGGKLYVNYSQSVKKTWERDPAGYIAKGVANWPAVLDR
jgi:hypothetical protein